MIASCFPQKSIKFILFSHHLYHFLKPIITFFSLHNIGLKQVFSALSTVSTGFSTPIKSKSFVFPCFFPFHSKTPSSNYYQLFSCQVYINSRMKEAVFYLANRKKKREKLKSFSQFPCWQTRSGTPFPGHLSGTHSNPDNRS